MSNLKRFAQNLDPNTRGGMMPDPAGGWVLWCEAETALRDALKSAKEAAGYEQGYNEAKVEFEHERTRTNQLLNELYHERARLEAVIKRHAERLAEFRDLEANDADHADQAWDDLVSLLNAFIDAHGT